MRFTTIKKGSWDEHKLYTNTRAWTINDDVHRENSDENVRFPNKWIEREKTRKI